MICIRRYIELKQLSKWRRKNMRFNTQIYTQICGRCQIPGAYATNIISLIPTPNFEQFHYHILHQNTKFLLHCRKRPSPTKSKQVVSYLGQNGESRDPNCANCAKMVPC